MVGPEGVQRPGAALGRASRWWCAGLPGRWGWAVRPACLRGGNGCLRTLKATRAVHWSSVTIVIRSLFFKHLTENMS